MTTYDKRLANALIYHATKPKLAAFIIQDPDVDNSVAWLVEQETHPEPIFKRIPFLALENLKPDERRIYVSPMSDEFADETRSRNDTKLSIALVQHRSLTPADDPLETEIEEECQINEAYLAYFLKNRNILIDGNVEGVIVRVSSDF